MRHCVRRPQGLSTRCTTLLCACRGCVGCAIRHGVVMAVRPASFKTVQSGNYRVIVVNGVCMQDVPVSLPDCRAACTMQSCVHDCRAASCTGAVKQRQSSTPFCSCVQADCTNCGAGISFDEGKRIIVVTESAEDKKKKSDAAAAKKAASAAKKKAKVR